jgi:hypothetical protein
LGLRRDGIGLVYRAARHEGDAARAGGGRAGRHAEVAVQRGRVGIGDGLRSEYGELLCRAEEGQDIGMRGTEGQRQQQR